MKVRILSGISDKGPVFIKQKQPRQVFCKKGVFRTFVNFTGKHLCRWIFCKKIASLRPAALLKKDSQTENLPLKFSKF